MARLPVAIRFDTNVTPGTYTIRVHNGGNGLAFVFRDDELVGEYEYDPALSI